MPFICSWCPNISPFITSFCFNNFIYHFLKTVGLLVRNSVSFPSSENVLLSLSFLKDILAGYKTLGWPLFSFSTMVYDEKFTVIQIGLPLSVSFFSDEFHRKIFRLQKFDYDAFWHWFIWFILFDISSTSWFCRFSQICKVFDHSFKNVFFDILFSSLTHLLSSWGSDYMNSSSCYGPTGLWGSVHFFQSIFMFKLVNF